jgi:hypothetical protein
MLERIYQQTSATRVVMAIGGNMGLLQHPFKEGILSILHQHFEDRIVKNFILVFEGQIYNKFSSKNIWQQLKDDCPVLEVRYKTSDETSEYICDVYPWASKKETEYRLLQYITDKAKTGKIGKDWVEHMGRIGISNVVLSGEYGTKGE